MSTELENEIAILELESSEETAAFYPTPEGFIMYSLARCDKCGGECSLSTPSAGVTNPDIDRLERYLIKLGVIRTGEPQQLGWSEAFNGALCETCDEVTL